MNSIIEAQITLREEQAKLFLPIMKTVLNRKDLTLEQVLEYTNWELVEELYTYEQMKNQSIIN